MVLFVGFACVAKYSFVGQLIHASKICHTCQYKTHFFPCYYYFSGHLVLNPHHKVKVLCITRFSAPGNLKELRVLILLYIFIIKSSDLHTLSKSLLTPTSKNMRERMGGKFVLPPRRCVFRYL